MQSVDTALLMIDNESNNLQPAALLNVAGKAIISRQISQLSKLGVKRFIISIGSMNSHILEFTNDIRKEGIEVEYVRSLHALGDILSDTDQFLLISEALLCGDNYIEALCNDNKPKILALENAPKYNQFELIDLEHRWAGLARIDGVLISSLETMPEDSDIHSTLLRLALQNECDLNIIKPSSHDIFKIDNSEQAKQLTDIYLQSLDDIFEDTGFVETFIFAPTAKIILPKLWKNRNIKDLLYFVPILIGGVSLLFLLLQWHILAFILAFIMCFAFNILRKYNYFNGTNRSKFYNIVESIFILLLLLLGVIPSEFIYYIITIISFLLCYSSQHLKFHKRISIFILSFPDIFLILLWASFWDVQGYAILAIILQLSLLMFIGAVLTQKNTRINQSSY